MIIGTLESTSNCSSNCINPITHMCEASATLSLLLWSFKNAMRIMLDK